MSFTSFKVAGDELPASVLAALVAELRPSSAVKSSDQIVNNSTVMVNDLDLVCAVAANAAYAYELHGVYVSNSTANFSYNFVLPAGTTHVRANFLAVTGASLQHGTTTLATVGGLIGNSIDAAVELWGYFSTTTAGTCQFQFCQANANASNTTMRAGSFLQLRRLS